MSNTTIIEQLHAQLQALEHSEVDHSKRIVSSPFTKINEWIPRGGFKLGSFVEILQDSHGIGSYALALGLARAMKESKPTWAVLDTDATFNPSVVGACGWDVQKLILVRASPQDGGWCFAQLVRSKDIGACFWSSSSMDNMVFRRLQFAAERGGGLGFVIRPMMTLRKPCWGSLRLQVISSGSNRLRLRLLHARGKPNVSRDEIEVAL